MSSTVIGVLPNQDNAEMMVRDLATFDYPTKDISVIVKEGVIKHTEEPNMLESVANRTVGGITAGGVVGGLTGLLVGIGALAIPGFGAVLIGGPIAAALGLTGASATTVSAAATGALAGGVVGALGGIGLPDESAKVYEEHLKSGGVILSVFVTDAPHAQKVKELFAKHHAIQIDEVSR